MKEGLVIFLLVVVLVCVATATRQVDHGQQRAEEQERRKENEETRDSVLAAQMKKKEERKAQVEEKRLRRQKLWEGSSEEHPRKGISEIEAVLKSEASTAMHKKIEEKARIKAELNERDATFTVKRKGNSKVTASAQDDD